MYICNTKDHVDSTPEHREETWICKVHRNIFDELCSNTVTSVWFVFSMEIKTEKKTEIRLWKSLPIRFRYPARWQSWFPLFKLSDLLIRRKSVDLLNPYNPPHATLTPLIYMQREHNIPWFKSFLMKLVLGSTWMSTTDAVTCCQLMPFLSTMQEVNTRGVLPEELDGDVHPATQNPYPVLTKICDFPSLSCDQSKNIPRLWPLRLVQLF